MKCYSPIFLRRPMERFVPCGRCVACHLSRARAFALRGMHELQDHEQASFLTLTYDDAHLPSNDGIHATLMPPHCTDFLKRLRYHLGHTWQVRYLLSGEYGERTLRPHYHLVLFGCDFRDPELVYHEKGTRRVVRNVITPTSDPNLYRSSFLDQVWGHGHVVIGPVTADSIAYVCKYTIKKQANKHLLHESQVPEFFRSSRRPGIGGNFVEDNIHNIFRNDICVVNGQKYLPPRYYLEILKRLDPITHRHVVEQRRLKSFERIDSGRSPSYATLKSLARAKLRPRKL